MKIQNYDWNLYKKSEEFLRSQIQIFLHNNRFAAQLSEDLNKITGTRFFDWIDHIIFPDSIYANELKDLGFSRLDNETPSNIPVYAVQGSTLPLILLSDSKFFEISLKVDSVMDFCKKNNIQSTISKKPYLPYRKFQTNSSKNHILSIVERHGSNDFIESESDDVDAYQKALNAFIKRRRIFQDDETGIRKTQDLVDKHLTDLNPERTADAFFQAERLYWQERCPAGRQQGIRQDKLGMGWANHDHHTFRCSRENFYLTIALLESLGFKPRERFYAGIDAGWGAQVLEHPISNTVIFADVDITESEKDRDFAHSRLQKSENIGSVGLWVGLHGESLLQAGLHHLAIRTKFEVFDSMENMMKPFSYFDFLKQAFSIPNKWDVPETRLNSLLECGLITQDKKDVFAVNGGIASHIESIQRDQGFKGFNQDSITAILNAVDPRKN